MGRFLNPKDKVLELLKNSTKKPSIELRSCDTKLSKIPDEKIKRLMKLLKNTK